MTAFIITEDLLTDPAGIAAHTSAVGLIGPVGASEKDAARLKAGEGIEFRLLDDDGEVYYIGRRLEESDADADYDAEGELAPLDCWGAPNAGCTIQEEKNKEGKWEGIN